MQIQAAVTTGPGKPFQIRTLDIDDPHDDEILVKIVAVGICHSDVIMRDMDGIPAPAVLGHEGAGVVEKIGAAVTKVAPGDRVLITMRSCGHCARCNAGDAAYCETGEALNLAGMRLDGSKALHHDGGDVGSNFFGQSSFATFALTYERNVVKVPGDVPLELMGPLACGIQTGAGSIMRSLACEADSSLLIIGGGSVGLAAVLGAKVRRCNPIIVAEPFAERRALALELGATHVIDPAESDDLNAQVRAIVPSGVNYAFDTTNLVPVQAMALLALAKKGVLGHVGFTPDATTLPGVPVNFFRQGLTIKSILMGDTDPDELLPELIERYRQGNFAFDRLITTFPFSQINEAVEAHRKGECVKVVLLMDL